MLGSFHGEVEVSDTVEELDIGIGNVPCEFPGGSGIGIGTIIRLVIGDSSEHSLGAFCFALNAVEHHGAQTGGKFGSHSLGHISSLFNKKLFCFLLSEKSKGAREAPLGRVDEWNYTPTGCLLRTGTGVNQAWRSLCSPRTMA